MTGVAYNAGGDGLGVAPILPEYSQILLTKSKLKVSSNTSALLCGFAMVCL